MYSRLQFAKNIYLTSRTRWLNHNVTTHQFKNRVFSTDISKACRAELLHTSRGNIDKKQKIVGYWWLGCSGMISVAVLLGGLTRLTESGLSMVTWKLLGEKRPTNQQEWEAEFNKYKQFPEFRMLNSSMTLEEFKRIYFMEYLHRMWGRGIGMFFLLPAVYFWSRGHFNSAMKKRAIAAGALIGAQGLMGWYMVKSGLEERFNDVNDVPRVSQYRLASHLSLAFFLHILCLSAGLTCLLPMQQFNNVNRSAFQLRKIAHISKGMVFLTAVSGAFVAGLDAGLIFNSFPKMGDDWLPKDILATTPVLKNFTENPTTVQFNHRFLGVSTVSLISLLYVVGRRAALPKRAIWAMNSLVLVAWAQVTLGVTTLLNHVPVDLAAAHQSGSLLLLSTAVWLTHELKFLKYIPK